jgi:hypothetical protein
MRFAFFQLLISASISTAALAQAPATQVPAAVVAQATALREQALAGSGAYEILESLTTEIGPRPAGSEAELRAAAWAVQRMKAAGLVNVHTERFPVPGWSRGREEAEVISPFPQRLAVTALGGSVATPAAGLEAELAIFKTFDELLAAPAGSLAGKIAVVTQAMPRTQDGSGYGANYRIRGQGASEAAKRGAVGYLLRSLATGDRRDPHTGTMTYAADVAKIPAGALSVPDAEQLDRMALRGKPIRLKLLLTPTVREGAYAETVVGEIVGRERPQEIVLIGGHLDSWDLGTGAVDDGAGVAITTAAASLIARLPQHPKRTLRLALFGAEEIGKAGPAYQQAHAAEELKHVIAAECDFGAEPIYSVELPAGAAESPFGRSLARLLAPLPASMSTKPAEDGGADMDPLTQVPKAAVLQDGTRYFDLHHTADDTLDKVSATSLDKAVAAWVSFAYLVADTDVDFRSLAAAKAAVKP